jgi:hypothetical protein
MTPATPIDPQARVLAAAVNWADRAPSLVESTRELLAAVALLREAERVERTQRPPVTRKSNG